jgi:hypothetical protein
MTDAPVLGLSRSEDHRYTVNYPPAPVLELPSVTTILDVLAKPALLNWYPKVAAYYALDNAEAVLRMAAAEGREPAAKLVAAQGRIERDRRGDIGTRAHQAVEHILAGRSPILEPDIEPLVEQYRLFTREWRFRPEWSEAMVVGEGYAGTFDLYGRVEGRRTLIDIKTGSFIAPEFGIQLAAYGGADFIGRPGTADRWRLPPIDVYAVLQLQPTSYRLIPYGVTAADLIAFRAAAELYRWIRHEGRRIIGQPLTLGTLRIA